MQTIFRIFKLLWKSLDFIEVCVWKNNYGKLFTDELTELLLEEGFIKCQYQMPIYYKYSLYGVNFFVLHDVDDCIYWYTYEALV